ncbi:MAG: DnaJ domain-containing protein [Candidatus Beckwithbacteria bacterium]
MTNEEWEDWYEILGVDPEASEEETKKAYRGLAKRLHPDHLGNRSESTRRWAEKKFKKINRAYEVLGNPQKRQQYDAKWYQRSIKPKPVVKPQYIHFDDIEPGKIQTSSFVIRNVGGPYKKIWISNPDSWVRVVRYFSLTDSDELPLQVEIEVEGEEWGKSYSEYIRVKLDEEETQVKVELQTKPEPLYTPPPYTPPPYTPPYTPPYIPPYIPVSAKRGVPAWVKGIISLVILGWIIGLIAQCWPSTTQIIPSEDTASTPVVHPTSVTQPRLGRGYSWCYQSSIPSDASALRMAIPIDLNSDGKMNEILAYSFNHLYAITSNGKLKWWVELDPLMIDCVVSCVPIDYDLDKKFNEILLFILHGPSFETVNVFNSHGGKIYESKRELDEPSERFVNEFHEMKTKYGYKISGSFIDEDFNRIDLDGDGEFDDIIRVQGNCVEAYSKIDS